MIKILRGSFTGSKICSQVLFDPGKIRLEQKFVRNAFPSEMNLVVCLSRFGRMRDAEKVFTRMLWLNPTDNQGARFNLYNVKEGKAWHAEE